MMIRCEHGTTLQTSKRIYHGFFGRDGGVSSGLYNTLNCGTHSHDAVDNVNKNRALCLNYLCEDAKLAEIHQTHSNIVHIIDKDLDIVDADGVVTKRNNIALSIVTADCAPVLFADPMSNIIGAAHAGWQGARSGILENTITAMCNLGANRSNIVAAVGPCILQESYEVGETFYDKFHEKEYFKKGEKKRHYLFDLEAFVVNKLKADGIGHIDRLKIDTYKPENRFFSYRRTTHLKENDYGRQISLILQK